MQEGHASVPEPPPQPHGIVIPDALLTHIELQKPHHWQELLQLVQERDAFGRKKYGQPLMSQDGRNGYEDARQELGDLLQYTYKMYVTHDEEGLKKIHDLLRGYVDVLEDLKAQLSDVPDLVELREGF